MAELVDATDSKSVSSRSAGSSPALGTTLTFQIIFNLNRTHIVFTNNKLYYLDKSPVRLLSGVIQPKTSVIALSIAEVI